MKKLELILKISFILLVFLQNESFCQWEEVKTNTNSPIHKFDILNEDLLACRNPIQLTSDLGNSWQILHEDPKKFNFVDFTSVDSFLMVSNGYSGNYYYSKNDNSWLELPNFRDSVIQLEDDGKKIYCVTFSGKIFYSDDFGISWTQKPTPSRCTEIYIVEHSIVACLFPQRYYISNLTDDNWTKVSGIDTMTNRVSRIISWNGNLLASTYKGVIISKDGGFNWESFAFKDERATNIYSIDKYLFAGINRSLLCSKDSGKTWYNITTDLPNGGVKDIILYKDYIFLSWSFYNPIPRGSLYKIKFRDFELLSVAEKDNPEPFSISPNPATDYIKITQPSEGWELSEGSACAVKIFNVFGELVYPTPTLPGGEGVASSQYSLLNTPYLKLDVSALVPGLYFVRIGSSIQKFIKI